MFGKDQSTSTIIDSSAKLDGKFSSQADLVVKGRMDGTIESTKNIEITESAKVKAEVKANNIIVAGKVEGNIEVIEKLNITQTGKIRGDVKCKLLNIEPGAMLDGKCMMPEEIQPVKEKKLFGKKIKSEPKIQESIELHSSARKESPHTKYGLQK
ncbi:polymer-forming cytoskeletal protein [Candidatus Parcubacteria bacterium]|nr:polymer-forming cytoskeletal protein [Patescibacteria group bacterium]MCG2687141.1 polymer-forming cytoskeletal protein [Candidatus Parcubacteria bacterium]